MKGHDSLVALVGDFVAVKRTPNHKPAATTMEPEVLPKRNSVLPRWNSVPKVDQKIMKFNDSLAALVGDFAAVKRTPNYKPTTATVEPEAVPRKDSVPKVDPQIRRHSLVISVGTVSAALDFWVTVALL
ncbi:hypothetical protein OESDEN_15703 [Oesophagostomum dentatum]|uniref:Uncharacterized protein n=1 Tax=Oesophagostomum dentatum TaxID=61180 RepID=A0A0B1SL22_OESDE|nr:hypothetical protein OESDEN_15703 [Oesophagostomum dentatum]